MKLKSTVIQIKIVQRNDRFGKTINIKSTFVTLMHVNLLNP